MKASIERLHYMDNLRALVMMIGVFFHAALAYSTMLHPVWLSADTANSIIVDWIVHFFHIFRMPLFFVVAGFFAALLVSSRGVGLMLKNRALRVLLPFVIFLPLVSIGVITGLGWALDNVESLSPLLALIEMFSQMPDVPRPPPTTVHLWFLYYLIFFYLLVWVLRQLPLAELKNRILALHPLTAALVLPVMLMPGLMLGAVPYAAPDSFMLQPWAFGFFGLFFAYGYLLFTSMSLLDYFERHWPWLVLVSLALYVVFFQLLPEQMSLEYKAPPLPERIMLVFCTAYIAVFMSIAGLVFARRWLNTRNTFLRYISDASYWVYIVHLPIVLMVQYWLLDQPGGVVYKFIVSSLLTLIISLVSYVLLVRWTPVGWLLNGKRQKIWR